MHRQLKAIFMQRYGEEAENGGASTQLLLLMPWVWELLLEWPSRKENSCTFCAGTHGSYDAVEKSTKCLSLQRCCLSRSYASTLSLHKRNVDLDAWRQKMLHFLSICKLYNHISKYLHFWTSNWRWLHQDTTKYNLQQCSDLGWPTISDVVYSWCALHISSNPILISIETISPKLQKSSIVQRDKHIQKLKWRGKGLQELNKKSGKHLNLPPATILPKQKAIQDIAQAHWRARSH